MILSIENLDVFKISHALTLDLYKLTTQFPSEEKFGLTSQIRRASSSVCANLMEGGHRNNTREYRQYTGISRGSVGELKYHLLLAKDLKYISNENYEKHSASLDRISRMLYGIVKTLEKQTPSC
jgi:four helix bundle protein